MKSWIRFSSLKSKNIDFLVNWLRRSHVSEFWSEPINDDQIRKKYSETIESKVVFPFIIHVDEKPVGYIQAYLAAQVGDGWWPDETEGTYGMDLYIGELDYFGKGYGSGIIQKFLEYFQSKHEVRKWIIDVSPKNLRAIRCYEKVGFRFIKEVMTPDGKANLMEKGSSPMKTISHPKKIVLTGGPGVGKTSIIH